MYFFFLKIEWLVASLSQAAQGGMRGEGIKGSSQGSPPPLAVAVLVVMPSGMSSPLHSLLSEHPTSSKSAVEPQTLAGGWWGESGGKVNLFL